MRISTILLTVAVLNCGAGWPDLDWDGDVDGFDFLKFSVCFNGSNQPPNSECEWSNADLDSDGDVDGFDFLTFANCYNGSNNPHRCIPPSNLTLPLGAGVTIDFVLVLPGMFLMGSPTGTGYSDEHPEHPVTITKPFYLGKYEVTQAQWQAVMGANPSHFVGDNRPVDMICWNDCQTFCLTLSTLGGRTVRLPSEAEWEYACRAGSTTNYCFGDEESQLGLYAWYDDNSNIQTHDVGGKLPNAWGLYDMHGNVWEWCQDWYDSAYYTSSPQTDPTGPSNGTYRVLRGGGWDTYAVNCRSADRGGYYPYHENSDCGLRVVVEME